MKTFSNLFQKLVSLENLEEAYRKARKHKSNKPEVSEFDKHWQLNLIILQKELKMGKYTPRPLKTFILRDPKTRKICKSNFRDRVVHHALVNVLQPIFEPRFMHDSYASRKGKGTIAALKRFDEFARKVARNGTHDCFVLKADVKHYFETVDHDILLCILKQKIKDENVLWLVKKILDNYDSDIQGKGMPLGNWTSQFFANVYLNELDQFAKHTLKAKYYLRYVDDFVILHRSKVTLEDFEQRIHEFLQILKLELHPTKCKIIRLDSGVSLLGFRAFYNHKLIRRKNLRKIYQRLADLLDEYEVKRAESYEVLGTLQGWNAYAVHGNTYKLRQKIQQYVEKELNQRTSKRPNR